MSRNTRRRSNSHKPHDPYDELLAEMISEMRYRPALNTIPENNVVPWAINHQEPLNDPSTLRIRNPRNSWKTRNLYTSPVSPNLPETPLWATHLPAHRYLPENAFSSGGRRRRRTKRRSRRQRSRR